MSWIEDNIYVRKAIKIWSNFKRQNMGTRGNFKKAQNWGTVKQNWRIQTEQLAKEVITKLNMEYRSLRHTAFLNTRHKGLENFQEFRKGREFCEAVPWRGKVIGDIASPRRPLKEQDRRMNALIHCLSNLLPRFPMGQIQSKSRRLGNPEEDPMHTTLPEQRAARANGV